MIRARRIGPDHRDSRSLCRTSIPAGLREGHYFQHGRIQILAIPAETKPSRALFALSARGPATNYEKSISGATPQEARKWSSSRAPKFHFDPVWNLKAVQGGKEGGKWERGCEHR